MGVRMSPGPMSWRKNWPERTKCQVIRSDFESRKCLSMMQAVFLQQYRILLDRHRLHASNAHLSPCHHGCLASL